MYRTWKDAEATLGKKREAKAKFETQGKIDKVGQTQAEIAEVNVKKLFNVALKNLPKLTRKKHTINRGLKGRLTTCSAIRENVQKHLKIILYV